MYGVKFTSHFVLCIALKINDCSDRLVKQKDVVLSGNGVRHAVGFVPRVPSEGELVVVDSEDGFGGGCQLVRSNKVSYQKVFKR